MGYEDGEMGMSRGGYSGSSRSEAPEKRRVCTKGRGIMHRRAASPERAFMKGTFFSLRVMS